MQRYGMEGGKGTGGQYPTGGGMAGRKMRFAISIAPRDIPTTANPPSLGPSTYCCNATARNPIGPSPL